MRRPNPDMETWLLYGGLAVAGYFIYRAVKNSATQPVSTTTDTSTTDTTSSTTTDGTGSQGSTTLSPDILSSNGI